MRSRRVLRRREIHGHAIRDNLETQEQIHSLPFSDAEWFLEKVFKNLSCYDLLDCSLVNRCFLQVARKFIKTYKIKTNVALFCLNNRIAQAESLTLYLGPIQPDILSCRCFGTLDHLTSLVFDGEESSLGFSYSKNSELVQLKHLEISYMGEENDTKDLTGVGLLTTLRSLRVCKDFFVSLEELSSLTNLTCLKLNKERFVKEELPFLVTLTQLQSLQLSYPTEVSDEFLFSILGKLVHLRELHVEDLSCTEQFLTDVVLKMSKLESLLLNTSRRTNVSLLNKLSELPNLQSLEICFDRCLQYICPLSVSNIPSLRRLKVSETTVQHSSVLQWILSVNDVALKEFPVFKQKNVIGNSLVRSEFRHLDELEISINLNGASIFFSGAGLHPTNIHHRPNFSEKDAPLLKSFLYQDLISLDVVLTGRIKPAVVTCLQKLQQLSVTMSGTCDLLPSYYTDSLSCLKKLTFLKFDATLASQFSMTLLDLSQCLFVQRLFLLGKNNSETNSSHYSFQNLIPMKSLRWLTISTNLLGEKHESSLRVILPLLRRIERV